MAMISFILPQAEQQSRDFLSSNNAGLLTNFHKITVKHVLSGRHIIKWTEVEIP